jgi:hypothetical protein
MKIIDLMLPVSLVNDLKCSGRVALPVNGRVLFHKYYSGR